MITCNITDPKKRYSRDLEQGGLEISCLLLFEGEQELLEKVRKLLSLTEKKGSISEPGEISHKIKQESEQEATGVTPEAKVKQEPEQEENIVADPEATRIKVEHIDTNRNIISPVVWATCTGITIKLYQEDKVLLEGNHRLNDKHINFAQAMLRKQFPQCDGLQNTLLQQLQWMLRCKSKKDIKTVVFFVLLLLHHCCMA